MLVDHLQSLLTPDGSRYGDSQYYLKAKAGEEREYSNLGAGVVGAVTEAAGQQSLNDLMQKGVFKPLGMTRTSWLLKGFEVNQLAVRYDVEQCVPWTGLCTNTESPVANHLIGLVFNPPVNRKKIQCLPSIWQPELSGRRCAFIGC